MSAYTIGPRDIADTYDEIRQCAERLAVIEERNGMSHDAARILGAIRNLREWTLELDDDRDHCDECGRCIGNEPCPVDGCDGHQTLHTDTCTAGWDSERPEDWNDDDTSHARREMEMR